VHLLFQKVLPRRLRHSCARRRQRQRPAASPTRMATSENHVVTLIAEYKELASKLSRSDCGKKTVRLNEEATYAYRTEDFEAALKHFAYSIALLELGFPSYGAEAAQTRPSLECNIGSCLHLLGDFDLAYTYYTAAREGFEALKQYRIIAKVFGDVNVSRIEYIDARLLLLEKGLKPDYQKYLDGSGKNRSWDGPPPQPPEPEPEPEPKEEVAVKIKTDPQPSYPLKSYLSPQSWRRWYRGEEPIPATAVDAAA